MLTVGANPDPAVFVGAEDHEILEFLEDARVRVAEGVAGARADQRRR